MVFVLGVLGVTTEFRYQTITPTVLQTPSRWALVTAKMITYALRRRRSTRSSASSSSSPSRCRGSRRRTSTSHYASGTCPRALLGVFAVVALFGIVGLGVGALLRNQIVAVVVGMIFLLVLQNIAGRRSRGQVRLPVHARRGRRRIFTDRSATATINGVTCSSTAGGVVVLLLWAFVPAILGAALTMNRDIT